MNKIVSTIIFFSLAATAQAQTAGEATIRLTGTTLMHEMRATPSPLDGAEISDRAVSFQWPLPAGLNILRSGLDGAEENTPKKATDKSKLRYFLRYSQTPAFKPEATVQAELGREEVSDRPRRDRPRDREHGVLHGRRHRHPR